MATVKKLRGRYQCAVRRKGYPHQYKVFDTEREAADWGDAVEDQMLAGTFDTGPQEPPPNTIRELLQRYVEQVSVHKTRKGRDDKPRIRRLQAILGAYSVHTLTSRRITQYRNDRLEAGAAAQTVLHDTGILHHAYSIACSEWGLVLKGPIPKTKRPKLPPGRNNRVPGSAVKAIRLATHSAVLGDIVEFAIETCMRRGELLSLTPRMIDLDRGTAFLPKTKNGEPRVVPLTRRAMDIVRPLVERHHGNRLWSIKPDSLTRAFCRAVRRTGHSNLRFHDTRHEGISRLFEQGYTVIEAARISGHKTLTQLNRYAHLDVGHLIEKMAHLQEREAA